MKVKHILSALALILPTATIAAADPVLPLPPRLPNAPTGSQLYPIIKDMTLRDREQRILDEIAEGNVPDFMRSFKPITVTSNGNSATYYALPDYMAIGTDTDFFRMPMSAPLAQQVADLCGSNLTTRKMVNDIYTAAQVKLAPTPFTPDATMMTVPVFWASNQAIETQRANANAVVGQIVGGIKKDIIVTPRLATTLTPGGSLPIAIYGWHQLNGTPIQNIYLGHENVYVDYSHGVRLVKNELTVNGQAKTVQQVLEDPALYTLLSDEGAAFTSHRYPIPTPYIVSNFPYTDNFPSTGKQLTTWTDRFKTSAVAAFSPTSPNGDGYVITVKDTSGGIDTTRNGRTTDADYKIECDVYCQYRPELSADGYERVGVFLRDDGNGLFDGTNGAGTIRGNNYAMTWDSHNGALRCLKTVNGVPTDLLTPAPTYPSTAWRNLSIEAVGSQLNFKLDGNLVHSTTDIAHAVGQFGIGYHEFFTSNANILGTRADNFRAYRPSGAKIGEWIAY